MGYFGRIWQAIRAQDAGGGQTISSPEDLARALGLRGESAAGVAVNEESAMRVAAVFRCTTLISGAVATMPLHIKRRIDDRMRQDASDHSLWTLLRRKPNPWQTPSQFKRQMQASVLLRGAGYAMKVKTGDRVVGLIPLHFDRVRVAQGDDFRLSYRYATKGGRVVALRQEDMFHLVGMPAPDGFTGRSVIGAARDAIGLALAAEKHGSSVFRNGTAIGGTLSAPGQLGDEVIARLKDGLEDFRGAANAGKNLVLEEGLKYEPLGMTQEDAQFIQSREFQAQDICMFFGVPPTMVGLTTKSTSWGTGIEQQSQGFVAYGLEDWLTTWEETITRDLVPDRQTDIYPRFNRKALVRGDIKARYGAYATARQWSLYTINELRALEDENPIEGGDDLFVPGNANGGSNADPFGPDGNSNGGGNDPQD
jgi:HK97 family phage portal protein